MRNKIIWCLSIFLVCQVESLSAATVTDLSNPEHKGLRDFVTWMRSKKYEENIVSKFVQDYQDATPHPDDNWPGGVSTNYERIAAELLKRTKPGSKFSKPLVIRYLDLVPLDANTTALPVDPEVVKEKFKQTFGMNVSLFYTQEFMSYQAAFGIADYKKIENLGGKFFNVASLNDATIVKWIKTVAAPKFFAPLPGYHRDIVRIAIGQIDGLKVTNLGVLAFSSADAISSENIAYVGNELPVAAPSTEVFSQGYGFYAHSHEWAHAWWQSHHYATSVNMPSYGTFGTLSIACNKKSDKNIQPMIDPLQAYLMEPEGGFDYPELILGKAYSDNLKSIDPCEVPFTEDPHPNIVIEDAVYILKATKGSALSITVKNTGDIPLALVPITVKLQCGKIKKTVQLTVNWIPVGATQSLKIPSITEGRFTCEKPAANISIDTTLFKPVQMSSLQL